MLQLGELSYEIEDVGLTRINLPRGGRIEFVTAAHRSRVGQRTTFCVMDELGYWLPGNHGHELHDAIARNLGGMRGRFLGTTNAWALGERSVAQRIAEAGTEDVYVDDVDPPPFSIRNKRERRKALRAVYGASALGCEARGNAAGRIEPWIDLDRIDAEIVSLLDRDEVQAARFFTNDKRAGEQAAFNVARFEELANLDHEPEPKSLVVIGVDGARFRDALAVIGCEVETGHLFVIAIETRPEDAEPDYEHDFAAVDGAVTEAFERFDVWRTYVDPQWIDPLVERWQGRWGDRRVIPWHTTRPRQVGNAVRRFADAIAARDLSHDGDTTLVEHVGNAVRKPLNVTDDEHQPLWSIQKDSRNSPRKIDAAMASVLAWEARGDARAEGADRPTEVAIAFA
jgi:hypothetical protein